MLHAPPRDRMSMAGLAAATFFIVSGGPYGLEEIVLGHGYGGALALGSLAAGTWMGLRFKRTTPRGTASWAILHQVRFSFLTPKA